MKKSKIYYRSIDTIYMFNKIYAYFFERFSTKRLIFFRIRIYLFIFNVYCIEQMMIKTNFCFIILLIKSSCNFEISNLKVD